MNPSTRHDEIIQVAAWAKFPPDGKQVPILAALDAPENASDDTNDRMCVSKLLGQYFVSQLASRATASVAAVNSASPSSIHDSQFNRDIDKTPIGPVIKMLLWRLGDSSVVGAHMMVDAAVHHGHMAPIAYSNEGKSISEQLWKTVEDVVSESSK
ncbi:hypothetical protein GGR52DRAFT_574491 [Hypoxylon sp. FL1284]|nr:hypothetical protein GGR52DRAFT_574491 [Hypoxylon sp. FL1284]